MKRITCLITSLVCIIGALFFATQSNPISDNLAPMVNALWVSLWIIAALVIGRPVFFFKGKKFVTSEEDIKPENKKN